MSVVVRKITIPWSSVSKTVNVRLVLGVGLDCVAGDLGLSGEEFFLGLLVSIHNDLFLFLGQGEKLALLL